MLNRICDAYSKNNKAAWDTDGMLYLNRITPSFVIDIGAKFSKISRVLESRFRLTPALFVSKAKEGSDPTIVR
jgi:hypothetical protein